MEKCFTELVRECQIILEDRQYNKAYLEQIKNGWDRIQAWMTIHKYQYFSKEIGLQYCLEELGGYLSRSDMKTKDQTSLRAARMLITYLENGDFEYRAPRVEHFFSGEIGNAAKAYLESCKNLLAQPTYLSKKNHLRSFAEYFQGKNISLEEVGTDHIEAFFEFMQYSLASRHNCSGCLRGFFRFCYDEGITLKDMSAFILPDNYKKNCKLPTTYEEDEIRRILEVVERASAIGKRDYLILLLASEYGWRSKDITNLQFDYIDWDKNVIRFSQHKTDVAVEYPLLSSVGNAIIDYLKHGRPESQAPQIIISHINGKRGEPLSSPTIHSIVTRYMRKANIKDWQEKRHGAHALRHSLATNLLKQNIPMPIISTVMGHQNTATTSIYLSVDIEKLRKCAIPVPLIRSPFYTEGGMEK